MTAKRAVFLGLVILPVFLLAYSVAFSQDDTAAQPTLEQGMPTQQSVAPKDSEMQWAWGEVISVDPDNNRLVMKVIDYETDTEKELTIDTDVKTAFENASSLADIKPKDNLSVDYAVGKEGKNVAKNISLEKPEAAGPETMQGAPETPAPESQQPAEPEMVTPGTEDNSGSEEESHPVSGY